MLETVREFGLEALAASDEGEAVRHAHADWCVAFAERAGSELAGPDHVIWWERIEGELGNIRAAHAWLFACGDAERALRLAGAHSWFWTAAGYFEEGRNLFNRLIAMPGVEDAPPALARVISSAADLEHWLANLDRAQEHYERALAIFRLVDDRQGVVSTLRGLGSVAIDQGDLEQASSLLGQVLAVAPGADAAWEAAAAARLLGMVAFIRGDYVDAIRYSEAALAGWQALADTGHVGSAMAMLGRATLAVGDHSRAAAVAGEVLSQLADAGDDVLVCDCLEVAAGLAETAGDWVRAAWLLAAAEAAMRRVGSSRRPALQAMFDRRAAAIRQALGEPVFAVAWAAGERSSLEEATAETFAVLDRMGGAQNPARSLPAEPEALTRREREVLRLLVDGMSDKEIAHALGITRRTASHYVTVIRRKLEVPSRAAAAALAVQAGLLTS
jgi:non-specific serine/threonine protein kinase